MSLDKFFSPQTIAIIGASREQGKIGNTILQNLIIGGYKGKLFPVNPNAAEILGKKCYPAIKAVPEPVDLAIVCVPAQLVQAVAKEIVQKKAGAALVISSGFKEIGKKAEEEKLAALFRKARIPLIGPNCLGVFDAFTKVDSMFLPIKRLERPKQGNISFISQSGALGSAMLDLAAVSGLGFAKFVSYGNAADINENHLLEYLAHDEQTKVICFYVEGLVNGKKFMQSATKVKKPVIALKGGRSAKGSEAALSHTGSIAGEAGIYSGAFRQTGIIEVDSLEEMFAVAHVFEKLAVKPAGKRVQIITNGGGHGIVTTDALESSSLEFAELSAKTKAKLKKELPPICIVSNPLDVVGDASADRFMLAISACLADQKVDALIVNLLPQTPTVDHEKMAEALEQLKPAKPVVLVVTGGRFAAQVTKRYNEAGFPVFQYPELAVKAMEKYLCHDLLQ